MMNSSNLFHLTFSNVKRRKESDLNKAIRKIKLMPIIKAPIKKVWLK